MNEKVKAINPQIVVHGTLEKPYYEISYYDTNDNQWYIGYSSYNLQTVKEYLDNCFEIIEADVEPVKHGRWLINSDGYYPYCPECNSELVSDFFDMEIDHLVYHCEKCNKHWI